MTASDADTAAYLLERLLVDQTFRIVFRRDPAAACRQAGLEQLAKEMAPVAGKAMDTLDVRESRSSLAGVLMAAALEGVAGHDFWKDFGPDLGKAPNPVGKVLSRIDLPTTPSTTAGGAETTASPSSEDLAPDVPAYESPRAPAAAAGEFRAITPEQATAYSSAGAYALGPTPEDRPMASAAAAAPSAIDAPLGLSEADVGDASGVPGDEAEGHPTGDPNAERDQDTGEDNDSISDDPSDELEEDVEDDNDEDDEGFDGDHDDSSDSDDGSDSQDSGSSSDDVGDVEVQAQDGGGDGGGRPSDAVGVDGGGSGTPRGPIVALARGEIGQAENPPGSNDSPRIREYRSAVPGGPVGPWCAYFASWVAREAGTPLGDHGQGYARVDDVWAWAQSSGRAMPAGSGGRPHPGDLIIWDEHMGVVESVRPDGTIQTVEGNSSDRVSERTYSGDGGAVGFVRMG